MSGAGLLFPVEPRARRRRDRILACLFAIALVALVVRAAGKGGGVLERNQDFGSGFLAGEDPYYDFIHSQRIHGPYPPSFVLVAAPLSILPTTAARVVWACAQAFALVACFLVLRGWARGWWPEVAPHASVLFAIALLLASRYLLRDMAGGGGNLIFLALALRGMDLFLRGEEVGAGLLFAASFVLKPNLAPLLLFLVARRAWRALLATALVGAGLFLLPAFRFGWDAYLELASRWAHDALAFARLADPRLGAAIYDDLPAADSGMNQSLRDALHRALDPLTGVGPAAWIARGLALLLAAWAFRAAWRARAGKGVVLAALAFLPLALLVSPITWKAHHVALLPLFFVLACVVLGRGRWSLFASGLAAYWLACDLLSEEVVGKAAKTALQQMSIVTWADVALLVATLRLAAHPDDAA